MFKKVLERILPQSAVTAKLFANAAESSAAATAGHTASSRPPESSSEQGGSDTAPSAGSKMTFLTSSDAEFVKAMTVSLNHDISASKSRKQLCGNDLQGNSYFEVFLPNNPAPRRIVEMKHSEDQLNAHAVPVQWESWLRRRRTHPPTLQELEADEQRKATLAKKVRELQEKEADGNSVGHAALPIYRLAPSQEPKRAGDAFQPGAWNVSTGSPAKKTPDADIAFREKETPFEPEAWQPGSKQ